MDQHASPFLHSVPEWDDAVINDLRIINKSEVDAEDLEVTWLLSELKTYIGIDVD